MTPEEGQIEMDNWFNNLPVEIEKDYKFLSENTKKFKTFDLLAYFSYYNHLHDANKYSDSRDDKHFFVSEVLSLLCLKEEFIDNSEVSQENYIELIKEMQGAVLRYCGKSDTLNFKKDQGAKNIVSDIASLLSREAKQIRNPGLPAHHLIFSEKLFKPIETEIKSKFGFTIYEAVVIRKLFADLINSKCEAALNDVLNKKDKYSREIINYRKRRTVEANSVFTKEQLEEYCQIKDKQLRIGIHAHLLNELFYNFSSVYTFSAEELANFSKIDLSSVEAFLKTFSCGFPSLTAVDKIYTPISILKSKPIIEHKGRYLAPSFPLLTWAVEEVVESWIKNTRKLNEKYSGIKHNFLLNEGLDLFSKLLPTASLIQKNLYYHFENERCETDGLVIYDKVLFIIEAKAQRITQKAKGGHELKTQDHLKDIIKDSYNQGIRTLNYIKENLQIQFKTEDGSLIEIDRSSFDDIVIVSLTLEPIGNISMLIKATNDIGYFNEGHFPWIISLDDLMILADLFENPIMLMHYVKRRQYFLSHEKLSIYEELDLVSYFMSNGLYIEHTLKDIKEKNISIMEFAPDTDEINDYYMFKFGPKKKFTPKPKFYISKEFDDLLLQMDRSKIPNRVRMGLLMLEFDSKSRDKLTSYIKRIKKEFAKDNEIHDCSIFIESFGGVGITLMTGQDKRALELKLNQYCTYKVNQLQSNIWIGLGDTSTDRKTYDFQTAFFTMKNEPGIPKSFH